MSVDVGEHKVRCQDAFPSRCTCATLYGGMDAVQLFTEDIEAMMVTCVAIHI